MAEQKYYVVWSGRKRGIFGLWNECNAQIFSYPHAAYKSFKSRQLAEQAFKGSSKQFIGNGTDKAAKVFGQDVNLSGSPVEDSIAVDGAWNTMTGVAEYQGVRTKTGEVFFKMGPFEDGTNNIVEYLAIVHALIYCKENKLTLPIYSDSRNAIGWVRDKKARTNHKPNNRNKKLFQLIEAANQWLSRNEYANEILKWETAAWGENPADFGRK